MNQEITSVAPPDSGPGPKPYKGKPANQRNLAAPNASKADRSRGDGKKRVAVPRHLPKPTMLHDYSHVKMSTTHPADSAIFGRETASIEATTQTRLHVSTPAAIDISRAVFAELTATSPATSKTILPECLDYYVTACIWLRVIHLKHANNQHVTQTEKDILINKLLFHLYKIQ